MCAWSVAALAAAQPAQSAPEDDWLRLVPADAEFYVELRDLTGIRSRFQSLGAWDAIRALSESSSSPPTTQSWKDRGRQFLGLTPEDAITQFLGRRAALMAARADDWENGVLIASVPDPAALAALLRDGNARPFGPQGDVSRYLLQGEIALAVRDRLLVFGPADDPDGLWAQTVLLLEGRKAPSLRSRSDIAGLRSTLGDPDHGLLYIAPSRTRSAAEAPLERLLAGVSIRPAEISCELRGRRRIDEPTYPPLDLALVASLPSTTLAAWSGPLDPDHIGPPAKNSPARFRDPIIGLIGRLFSGAPTHPNQPAIKLGPQFVFAIGADQPKNPGDPPLPALTFMTQSSAPAEHLAAFDRIARLFVRILMLRGPDPNRRLAPPPIHSLTCEGVEIQCAHIGPILVNKTGAEILEPVDLCWAALDNLIIVTTSRKQARSVIRAARRKAPRLDQDAEFQSLLATGASARQIECAFIRGRASSAWAADWIAFLEKNHPESLKPEWWQSWAEEKIEARARLGVGLVDHPDRPREALVRELEPGSPGMGHLRAGDIITAVDGAPLLTDHPAREIAERYAQRGRSKSFSLEIRRGNKTLTVNIPVAPAIAPDLDEFDPIGALRQFIVLARRCPAAAYSRFDEKPEWFQARIVIQLK